MDIRGETSLFSSMAYYKVSFNSHDIPQQKVVTLYSIPNKVPPIMGQPLLHYCMQQSTVSRGNM